MSFVLINGIFLLWRDIYNLHPFRKIKLILYMQHKYISLKYNRRLLLFYYILHFT